MRKETKKLNVPGPGTHEVRSYFDKDHPNPTSGAGTKWTLQKRLTEGELKEYRANLYRQGDGLGPGQYNAQLA